MMISHYLSTLKNSGYQGEIRTDFGTRLALSTDNSIYQKTPEAVLFPKTQQDLIEIFTLASQPEFLTLKFTPRAGGTGTDGQSLNSEILIDCSKYLTQILEINLDQNYARVEPGVVLDQLNLALKPHGVFFAPQVSPSNRACIGGMFNTDGCGLGAVKYGRTSQHVLGVTAVLPNGEVLKTGARQLPLNSEGLSNSEKKISHTIFNLLSEHQGLIQAKNKTLPRFFTGYNLLHPLNISQNQFDLTPLLSGSEGTLAFITELKIKLTPLPKYKALFVIKYLSFDQALRHGRSLLSYHPAAIETIDDKIINLARHDEIFLKVKPMFESQGQDHSTQAINLLEITHEDSEQLQTLISNLSHLFLTQSQQNLINGFFMTSDPKEINTWWDLRKKSVGLLANLPGKRQPVPFVEDTAVDPAVLPEFIAEFKKILDQEKLIYGMFGHLDNGCIHVRPALDMTDPNDAKKIKIISDQVQQLAKKYHGLLWAEHGAGYRSAYIPEYIGPELTQVMKEIKTLFDPHHQLNPGKIISADPNIPIVTPGDPTALRAVQDSQVPEKIRQQFEKAFKCNGNAICMNVLPDIAICPSYKITRDRVHSPKGRAVLMREYLRQEATQQTNPVFIHEVKSAMDGCLGCKSCVSGCPVNLDVPALKSEFYARYYQSSPRPLRECLIAYFELLTAYQAKFKQIFKINFINKIKNYFLKKIGLQDLPNISTQINALRKIPTANLNKIKKIQKPVLLIGDTLTRFYEPELLLDTAALIQALGYTPFLLPYFQNGKSFHALGDLKKFEKIIFKNQKNLAPYHELNIPILGIEPALSLAFRDEYQNKAGKILLLSEWLQEILPNPPVKNFPHSKPYYLLPHCSEKALAPKSAMYWQKIFKAFGLELLLLEAGCCGMAGVYGHLVENQNNSKGLYQLSWENLINTHGERLLATGYSCRCQVKRFSQKVIRHPVEVLSEIILIQANLPKPH